jgi:hypothetical protein
VTVRRLVRAASAGFSALLIASAALAAADQGVAWSTLTPQQKQALSPLQRDWATLDATRRQKWLEVAGHFPTMPADERKRVQERMAEWARLTPAARAQARMQFQEVRQLPAQERNAKWQAYQALPEEERKSLAQRVQATAKAASAVDGKATTRAAVAAARSTPIPASGPLARSIGPIVVQARPGATTTTMSTRANLPPHHQPGAPKIAATAGYVDPATLLPRRAAQAVAPAASGADMPEAP